MTGRRSIRLGQSASPCSSSPTRMMLAAWIGQLPLDENFDGSLSGAELDAVIGTTAETVAISSPMTANGVQPVLRALLVERGRRHPARRLTAAAQSRAEGPGQTRAFGVAGAFGAAGHLRRAPRSRPQLRDGHIVCRLEVGTGDFAEHPGRSCSGTAMPLRKPFVPTVVTTWLSPLRRHQLADPPAIGVTGIALAH